MINMSGGLKMITTFRKKSYLFLFLAISLLSRNVGAEYMSTVDNYADEFNNIKHTTGTNKKLCGHSVRYPDGRGTVNQAKYQRHLGNLAKDMAKWSRGKFSYDTVRTFPQAVMPTNAIKSKAVLIGQAKSGRATGSCDLNVFKGAFHGSNAPSRNQANCGGVGMNRYCLRHEAGHTWGLAHDNYHDGDSCKRIRIGISQMGGYKAGFNIPHLHWLGWLEENQVKQLQWTYADEDNYIFGEHWISIRPLSVDSPSDEGEHPYGLVIDLRRTGNRLWLSSNREDELRKPGDSGYDRKQDALIGMVSPPFETWDLTKANRWKRTSIYRFVDENNPWNDKLMDDIVISVVKRTPDAMLVRIEESDTFGSCSELPEASYKITKYRNSINSIRKMGVRNLNIDFEFELDYENRDSRCSKKLCDVKSVVVKDLWETCYFEGDQDKTNLLENSKVKITPEGKSCEGPLSFKTYFNKGDRKFYADKFSSNIICKAAYQCFYDVDNTIKFPVNGEKLVNVKQTVAIKTIYPNQWKNIIERKRSGLEWADGPYSN